MSRLVGPCRTWARASRSVATSFHSAARAIFSDMGVGCQTRGLEIQAVRAVVMKNSFHPNAVQTAHKGFTHQFTGQSLSAHQFRLIARNGEAIRCQGRFLGTFKTELSYPSAGSWEALPMLGVPAHRWDNQGWAGVQAHQQGPPTAEFDDRSKREPKLRASNAVASQSESGHALLSNSAVSQSLQILPVPHPNHGLLSESRHEDASRQKGEEQVALQETKEHENGRSSETSSGATCGNASQQGHLREPMGGLAWLKQLHIRKFALVDNQIVPFGPGLNVITGESGAGKSILLQALGQILGAPLAEDSIRPPATSASLEGHFVIAPTLRPILAFHLDGHPTAVSATLGEAGTRMDGGAVQLVLTREIISRRVENGVVDERRGGKARSVCKINGAVVPLKVLRRVGAMLVDVNGQNSQITLRTEAAQLEMLDRHAGASSQRGQFTQYAERARAIWREMEELGRGGKQEEEELLEFVEEVQALGLDYGEEDALRNELKQLEAEQAAADHCRAVHSLMSEAGPSGRGLSTGRFGAGISGSLRSVSRELQAIVGPDSDEKGTRTWSGEASASDISDALDMVIEAQALLEAAEARVQEFASSLRFSESRMLQLKQKLRQLQKLLRTFDAETADELLERAEAAEERLNGKGDAEKRREELQSEWDALVPALCECALELSLQRRRAAEGLRQAVEEALKQLAMERSRFHVDVAWVRSATSANHSVPRVSSQHDFDDEDEDEFGDEFDEEDSDSEALETLEEPALLVDKGLLRISDAGQVGESPSEYYHFTSTGVDKVTFKLAASAGEPLLPLTNVASGGECARVMLALKTVPGAAEGGVPVAVFDELDSGVGGRIGARVGSSLRRLASAGHQVLCVTHLPQVAAYADQHVRVLKEPAQDGRLVTKAEVLDREDNRLEEIASMLGLGLPAAQDLLASVHHDLAASTRLMPKHAHQPVSL